MLVAVVMANFTVVVMLMVSITGMIVVIVGKTRR